MILYIVFIGTPISYGSVDKEKCKSLIMVILLSYMDTMYFLHDKAKERGANKIRLKVYEENLKARLLYKKIGYKVK